MAWHALYETSTGRLLSVGTVIAYPLPAGVTAQVLAGPPADNEMWDEPTRSFVPRPAKVLIDRLDDLASHIDYQDFRDAWASLSTTNKTKLRNAFIRLLGGRRYRNQTEPIAIDLPGAI